jgi:hypothetical protein
MSTSNYEVMAFRPEIEKRSGFPQPFPVAQGTGLGWMKNTVTRENLQRLFPCSLNQQIER